MKEQKHYMEVFNENWEKHVTTDGELVLDKVARELADCTFIIEQYKDVMEEVTQGRISKIFTYGSEITKLHRQLFISRSGLLDDLEEIQDEDGNIEFEHIKKYLS